MASSPLCVLGSAIYLHVPSVPITQPACHFPRHTWLSFVHAFVHGYSTSLNGLSPHPCLSWSFTSFKTQLIFLCNLFCFLLAPSESEVKVRVTQSCPSLQPHGLYSPRNYPGQNTGVGSCSLLQGIFPTQGSNPGLRHYQKEENNMKNSRVWICGHSQMATWVRLVTSNLRWKSVKGTVN